MKGSIFLNKVAVRAQFQAILVVEDKIEENQVTRSYLGSRDRIIQIQFHNDFQ